MASTYYVSQQRGDDSNNGTSPSTPKATLAALQAVMGADGDTAYIGPGTYRERYVVQNVNQTFRADPGGLYVVGDTPGRVRITGCDANEIPSSGAVVDFNGKTGCSLLGGDIDHLLIVDGSSDYYAVYGVTLPTCQYVEAGGYYGFFASACTQCAANVNRVGFYDCDTTLCVSMSPFYPYQIVGTSAARTALNCIAIGGFYGYMNTGTGAIYTVKNCMAFLGGNSGAFSGDSRGMSLVNCAAHMCQQLSYGRNASYPLDISSCYYSQTTALQRGSGYETGTPTAVGIVVHDWPALIRAFEPIIYAGIAGLGTPTGAPATDIIGRALPNPPPIGPWYPINDNGRWWRPQI